MKNISYHRKSATRMLYSAKSSIIGMIVLLGFFLTGCGDVMTDYFEKPVWLKGNIYDVLEQDGHYKLFLEAVDKSGFKQMVKGKTILTVIAPDDSAFTEYLSAKNIQSIDEMDQTELQKMVGFHLMYYAFGKDKLINFRPNEGDDATEAEKDVNAGLYYKFRTKSNDAPTMEWDNLRTIYLKVYHQERFLPVFSYEYFNTRQIDATYNYEYFFPNTSWKGQEGFNVSNAAVKEYEVIASNGYVHEVDKVLRPLETIYTELRNRSGFSKFLNLYNNYEYFAEEENLTIQYGNGSKLYQHYHIAPLANIACEWPVIDYSELSKLSFTAYSVFAPSNAAIDKFFNSYWKVGGYDSLPQVSSESMKYLLFNCVYPSALVFPEEIKKNRIKNSYGTVINFDVDAVPEENRIMCSNGALYGCEELAAPAMFTSVTGPAFQYKKYGFFLKMLASSNLTNTLCSNETRYLSLIPSNDQMAASGITVNKDGNLLLSGNAISSTTMTSYVYAHTVSLDATPGSYTEIPSTGAHVLKSLSPSYNLYWYALDGKVTNSIRFNERIYPGANHTDNDLFSNLVELKFDDHEWNNGKVYSYDNNLMLGNYDRSNYKTFQLLMYNNRNDETMPFQGFVQLLIKAGMFTGSVYNFVLEDCLTFAPETNAVKTALEAGQIPGITYDAASVAIAYFDRCKVTDIAALKDYMMSYFIPLSTAGISNFPFIGWNERNAAGFPTLQSKEVTEGTKVVLYTTALDIQDDGSKLSVRQKKDGQSYIDVVSDYHFFPFVFDDACVHFLKACF